MLKYRRIDLQNDGETIISFRKDSYMVSFGNIDGFGDRIHILDESSPISLDKYREKSGLL